MSKEITTKVKWQKGMPDMSLRIKENDVPRQFLVKGEWSLQVATMFDDGSGFDTGDSTDWVEAWAIIDGF